MQTKRLLFPGEFIAYVIQGSGMSNGNMVSTGDLIRGNDLEFHAMENTQIILVREIEK